MSRFKSSSNKKLIKEENLNKKAKKKENEENNLEIPPKETKSEEESLNFKNLTLKKVSKNEISKSSPKLKKNNLAPTNIYVGEDINLASKVDQDKKLLQINEKEESRLQIGINLVNKVSLNGNSLDEPLQGFQSKISKDEKNITQPIDENRSISGKNFSNKSQNAKSIFVEGNNNNFSNSPRKTSRYMSKYELATIIAYRAAQLESNEMPLIPIEDKEYDPLKIAQEECNQGKLNLIIKRILPDRTIDYYHVNKLELPT